MGRNCEVHDCPNNMSKTMSKSFHSFPRDKATCLEWVRFCKSEELNEKLATLGYTALRCRKICSDHFAPESFRKPLQPIHGLMPKAVPIRLKVEVVGEYVISYSEE